jgi:ribosomal 30S subunit maturation factor RimM
MKGVTRDMVVEALLSHRQTYRGWLKLHQTTDEERELAKLKITVINQALSELEVEAAND